MRCVSEQGSTFSKTVLILIFVGIVAIYGIYWCLEAIDDAHAESIVKTTWNLARQEQVRLDPDVSDDEETVYSQAYKSDDKGYTFSSHPTSTANLVKIDTGSKIISTGVCKAIKRKLKENSWRGVFLKVFVLNNVGEERNNILIYKCPKENIAALRFYVKFADEDATLSKDEYEDADSESEAESVVVPASPIISQPSPVSRGDTRSTVSYNASRSSSTQSHSTSSAPSCPMGSSRNASGAPTNVSGCRCNDRTPLWIEGRCVKKCSDGFVNKRGTPSVCVECNKSTDCPDDKKCWRHMCVADGKNSADCRWGVCQTCTAGGVRTNLPKGEGCEAVGLPGSCNGNGICYPTKGRHCSAVDGCPDGQFCNYGSDLNTSKNQKGAFGQTPNVCQVVSPVEFEYKGVIYYYNSEKDLKAWCRAGNNKPNCLWGYLAKFGAESWCASLGKRLLTKAEMEKMWNVLKPNLPQMYNGYAYWVQEGVWIEGKDGKRHFGRAYRGGYGGRGGVVCK